MELFTRAWRAVGSPCRLRGTWSLETRGRIWDALVATGLFFLAQFFVCGLQHVTAEINNFPAPIIAMLAVAVVMMALTWLVGGVDVFYHRYLRRPTDLLNRHMSIGFTVPFTMVFKGPSPTLADVGLIISGFLITGILNSGLAYFASRGLQGLICQGRHQQAALSLARMAKDRQQCMSEASTITNNPSLHDNSDNEPEGETEASNATSPEIRPQPPSSAARCRGKTAVVILKASPVLWLSLVALAAVGLPIALTTGDDASFDTFLLLSLWTGTLAAQSTAKTTRLLRPYPRFQAFVTATLNAVLWSSLGMIVYAFVKARVKHTSTSAVLDSFQTGTTVADLISPPPGSASAPRQTLGAGDIAISILDAGIVAWGLKLFECRAQLLSRAGMCTLAVATVAALANVVCGPLLVHAMGLRPANRALAFAARSVTLALAGPAMASLGGDVGLNAAMVVFNGIAFQMGMGLGVAEWAEAILLSWGRWLNGGLEGQHERDAEKGYHSNATSAEEAAAPPDSSSPPRVAPENLDNYKQGGGGAHDTPQVVGTGVAVGINAAAMGTAYLYENGSRAAPYAALSMTTFGVMTVVFTSIRPLAAWLTTQVS